MATGEAVPVTPARSVVRPLVSVLVLVTVLGLLFGVPWWFTVALGRWPAPVAAAGTAVYAVALVAFPVLMYLGHGRRHLDRAARAGDTLLGLVWILFVWA